MSRLADYFVVVGYDHEKERSGMSSGMILQRFPEKDWSDTPFMDGIEWFCQPQGWALSTERQEPKFFVSVLTDIDANRHYCACLCFNETVSITPSKPVDEEEDNVDPENSHPSLTGSLTRTIPAITHHSIMYAPKCLVLVSRLDYIETFRNCLGIMYTVYVESMPIPLETLVGNVLGCIQVPPPGGPQVRFSIGAGDRQALQPPLSPSLPVTNSSVSLLFQQLGIRNVLCLFCAIMTEHKILFHSKSYSRLTEGSHALTALMYPFRYSHVYIPLLPAALVEVLSTPTPFIMGVHSSLRSEISDLMDVIIADLDGGSITVPDGVSLPLLPQPLLSQAQDSLTLVLQPELAWADHAFPPATPSSSLSNASHSNNGPPNQPQYQTIPKSPAFLDKEIRAVFMRIFAQLLQGYRSCLTIIRIHPRPVITFHKAAFLGERGLTDCDFTTRVLDCMFFTSFVQERGPPWRPCDVWDELHSNLLELLRLESQEQKSLLAHIQDLAHQLYTNENPNPQPYVQKILKPPDGAFARIHQPPLPVIDGTQVQAIIDEGLAKNNLKSRLASMRPAQPRIVPMGPHISSILDNRNIVSNSARRLEVLRNCINCIFENKISDARKTFPAVLRALKSKQARLALCSELAAHVIGNKAMLEHQQFDLVVRLMNCALQDDSAMDENGVAAALLPLATAFCRKLCTGVIQFAYTCIQDHPVWQNQQFWEAAFYQDVQKDIKALYLPRPSEMATSPTGRLGAGFPRSDGQYTHHHHHHHYSYQPPSLSPVSPREIKEFPWKDRRSGYLRPQEPSALEIAAEQMRIWPNLDPEKQKELVNSEESTMYSQAIHYANRMVYLLVPLDVGSRTHKQDSNMDEERASNSITNSVAESDSAADAESGFEEQDPGEAGSTVIRMVSRFVDKVCTEGGVSAEHVRCLHQMVPGVVHMHIETLEAVHRESKRLPPIQKPKILTPNMLPGEELVMEGLRVYLLPDGREEWTGGTVGALLPAEGALFLTNYRIIFKGTPCDPFACEQVVVRAFPVTSLTKEKRISVQYLSHLDQYLQEGLQLRSCTFQLVKLAFDEEVTSENVESLRKMIHRLRHPPHVFHHFAFTGQVVVPQTPLHKGKEKNATLKGFAKKTLLKTARKAGFKQKATSKRQKYVLPNMSNNSSKYLTSPGRMSLPPTDPIDYGQDDDVSILDEFEMSGPSLAATPAPADAKTLERLSERSYVRDWRRMGLCSTTPVSTPTSLPLSAIPTSASNSSSLGPGCRQRSDPFRITTINSSYILSRSYPALLVVPSSVTDESIRRLCRCHRHCRFPAITWRHPRTGALLVRGAGFHGKGVIGILKGHPSSSNQAESHSNRHGELQPRMVIPHQIASGGEMSHSSAHPTATTASTEQEKYLSALVAVTPIAMMRLQGAGGALVMSGGGGWGMSDSSLSIDSLLLAAEDHLHGIAGSNLTPESSRRANPFNKAMGTLRRKLQYLETINRYKQPYNDQDLNLDKHCYASAIPGNDGSNAELRMCSKMGKNLPPKLRYDIFGRSSGGKGPRSAFGRWGSLKDRRHNSQSSLSHLPPPHGPGSMSSPSSAMSHMGPPPAPSACTNGMGPNRHPNPRLSSDSDSGTECMQTFQRAAMYIFGEKAQMKGMKAESPAKADFIPVEYFDVRHTKTSFKKLMRACIPSSSPASEPEQSFHKLIETSEWLQQLQNIMQLAGAAVDLLDVQGSSVMICLEDGWDVTCQVSSVAQLCLDPHYRTIEGFRVLVEKEWLAFGHRFSHRSNLTAPSSQTSGFAPTFLQFLDVVHQIHKQFPLAFEFNDAYLRFLAYHYVSCRFRTFLLDSELERVECGIAAIDDKKGSLSSHHKGVETGSDDEGVYPGGRLAGTNMGSHLGPSVFDYIEKQNARSPVFYNFMYTPDNEHPVLRPQSHLANLEVWEYYLGEEMSHGPNYDFEVIQMDSQQEEEAEAADGVTRKTSRRVVTMGYDGTMQSIPDAFSHLLEEIHRLETELGHLPQKWNVLWDKLELPTTDSLTRHSSFTTQLVRWHGRLLHKRSTLEILMRGKMVGAAEAASSAATSAHVLSHPHRFERYNYTTPTYCDLCPSVLWGPVKTGMRCMDCGYSCHEKCMESVPKNCTKYKAVTGDGTLTAQTMTGRATGDSGSVSSGVTTMQTSSQQYYDQFSSNVAENRTHEGYLYKRGALLKGWKQRWFVLDSIKHQLRYYDAMEDSHCKGFIDLAEVMSVTPAPPAPGPPKKTDDKSFFDLRTNRRTYNFCASDATSAQEWIEKIQACLQ